MPKKNPIDERTKNIRQCLYRFHILSSTHDIKNHAENCNLQAAAHKEVNKLLKKQKTSKCNTCIHQLTDCQMAQLHLPCKYSPR
jgi:hypothetical protein